MARFLHDGPPPVARRQGQLPSGMGYNAAIGMGGAGPLSLNPYSRNGMGRPRRLGDMPAALWSRGMGKSSGGTPSNASYNSSPTVQAAQANYATLQGLVPQAQAALAQVQAQAAQDAQAYAATPGVNLAGLQAIQSTIAQAPNQITQAQAALNDSNAKWFAPGGGSFTAPVTGNNYITQANATLGPPITNLTAIANLPVTLSNWEQQAQATVAQSQAAATAAATAQNQADNQLVANARASAQAQASSGNYAQALATLQAANVVAAASRLGVDLSGDVNAITAAQSAAQTAAQKAADQQTVTQAQTQAVAYTGQGNYSAALAALQSTNVAAAASRLGVDLTPNINAVTGAQQQAATAAAAQTAAQTAQTQAQATATTQQQTIASCAQAGGTWNGMYCDMTAVNQCTAKGGTFSGGVCDMSTVYANQVNAAIAAAQATAAANTAAGFTAALGTLAGVASVAVQAGMQSQLAAAQAQIQAQQAQAVCADQQGTWDAVSGTCSGAQTPAQIAANAANAQSAAAAANQPPAWIAQLLPTLLAASPAPAPAAPAAAAPVYQQPVSYGYAAPAPAASGSGMSAQQQTILALLQSFGGAHGAQFASALTGTLGTPAGTVAPGAVPDGTPCTMGDGSAGNYLGGICSSAGAGYGAPYSVTETF